MSKFKIKDSRPPNFGGQARLKIQNSESGIFNFQSSMRSSGFTLIELMAVIAIILLLASIMIPNIAKNVERGRRAKAEADVDILIKAISLFQIDHEGELPSSIGTLWSDSEGPYISSKEEETPWGGSYSITSGTGSYTIVATDDDGNEKFSKTITFE